MDTATQVKRVNDAIDDLSMTYYNIAPLIYNMKMRPSARIETLCVDSYGRGLFNPIFVSNLDVYQLKFVLMHETYHVLLRHMNRFDKIKDKCNNIPLSTKSKAFNIAADSYINDNLIKSNRFCAIDGCVDFDFIRENYNVSYEEFENMNTEELYYVILKESVNNNSDCGICSSDSENGSGLLGDIYNAEKIEEVFGDSYKVQGVKAKNKASEAAGSCMSDNDIIEINEKNTNVDWEKALNKFAYSVSGRGEYNRTWRRQSRRYRDIYPYSKGRMKNTVKDILISIDVSDSMDANKLATAVSVVEKLSKKYSLGIKYSLFNCYHTPVYEFTSIQDLKNRIKKNCGGGTYLQAAIRNGNIEQKGIVIISDMEFNNYCEYNINMLNNLNKDYFLIDVKEKDLTDTKKSEYENAAGERYMRVG